MNLRAALSATRQGGPSGLLNFVRDYRQAQADRANLDQVGPRGKVKLGSSISDAGLYPLFCQMAADDPSIFARFRRSLIYRDILEHVTKDQGSRYLAEIKRQGIIGGDLQRLLSSDTVGAPYRYMYGSDGLASPSTLRYVKVASDLAELFGPLSGMTVAEIGVGYGGQCRVLTSVWRISRYRLYDIPEVLALATQFLDASDVDQHTIDVGDGRAPDTYSSDLLISNYAFSELHRDVQEMYWEKVIRNSSRGYVTYNHISPEGSNSMSATEFADRIPGARILPEIPLTHPDNVIVAWGLKTSRRLTPQ